MTISAPRGLGLRLASGLLSCTALAGCGPMLETAHVERRFQALFSCQEVETHHEAGGYRVEGCGRVAHFGCFDPDPYRHHRHDHSAGEAISDLLVEGLLASDTCVLEHTEAPSPRPREAPVVVAARTSPKGPVVHARVLLAGGYLALTGKPLEYAEHALIKLHSTERLTSAACSAQLYHDGVPILVEKLARTSAYDVQLVIRVEALRSVDRAVRFAGDVCGVSFELGQDARTTLGLFEARFREELARMQTPVVAASY